MSLGNGSARTDWSDDSVRAHAFRDVVAAISACDSYTAAVEAAARPIAVGLGAAIMIGLLDGARDVVHPLGVHDPLPTRSHVLDSLFDEPFEHRGHIGQALDQEQPVLTELDDDYIDETFPKHAGIGPDFRLRHLAIAPFKTLGGIAGVVWAARADDEPPFGEVDAAFLTDCGVALTMAIEAGFLREALQRSAGRRAPVLDPGPPAEGERRRETVLSDRERDVLRLLAAGLSNERIGAELAISPQTVRTHIEKAMAKLSATTRTQAVAIAIRESLIT